MKINFILALFLLSNDIVSQSSLIGPDAPDLEGIELNEQLILMWTNSATSNNFKDHYMESFVIDTASYYYKMEGYIIYQLKDQTVGVNDLKDTTVSKIVFQCDFSNDVIDIYNWKYIVNPFDPNGKLYYPILEAKAANKGLSHSTKVDHDAFTGNKLVNGEKYFYTIITYAYNNYLNFNPVTELGQQTLFLESTRNTSTYELSPRAQMINELNLNYGSSPVVTRLNGTGNDGFNIELDEETKELLLTQPFNNILTYKQSKSPIDVKVIDPLKMQNGSYKLELFGKFNNNNSACIYDKDSTYWKLTDLATNKETISLFPISQTYEQIIDGKGFSIKISQPNPNDIYAISQDFVYADETKPKWLSGIRDNGRGLPFSMSVKNILDPIYNESEYGGLTSFKSNKLNDFGEGIFFPFYYARYEPMVNAPYISPAFLNQSAQSIMSGTSGNIKIKDLNNVDIMFTSDKSKWSRCLVVESSSPNYYQNLAPTLFGEKNMDRRSSPSIDKNGLLDQSGTLGYSWFPGYAIDVESGKRLNIFFGENTSFSNQYADYLDGDKFITTDMVFNPSSQLLSEKFPQQNESPLLKYIVGGQHFIYVTRQEYDGCEQLGIKLDKSNAISKKYDPMSCVTWTCVPLLNIGTSMLPMSDGLIPNDLTVRLRVSKPFSKERIINNLDRMRRCDVMEEDASYLFEFQQRDTSPTIDPKSEAADIIAFEYNKQILFRDLNVDCLYRIFNSDGRLIMTGNLIADGSPSIDISNIPSDGILFLNLKSLDQKINQTFKLINIH